MRVLMVLTVVCVLFFLAYPRADIALSSYFVEFGPHPVEPHGFSHWQWHPLLRGLYRAVIHVSNAYIVLLVIAGLYKLCRGTRVFSWLGWRFLVLVLLVGPLLCIELGTKSIFERPRPRDIVEFRGPEEYVAPLHIGKHSGNSFVSSHAAAGFYVVAFAMLARTRRLRVAVYALGVMLGLGIGLIRVMGGGHFASDIVFAGLIMLWTIHLLAHFMLKHKEPSHA